MTKLELGIIEEMEYEKFVKIISNIPSCIFFKDTDLKYRFSSHCWAQLISDDIIGKTDLEIRKDKENAMKAMDADREIIKSGKGCSYVIKSDIDGEVSYLELIKEPIYDDDGNLLGIVGLINDVTEKTIMENRIVAMSELLKNKCKEQRESLEQIQKMNVAQKMFTASMNHELRSPLNGIIGNLQLLLEDDTLTAEQKQYIDNAFFSSQQMLEIVNELLDFAKMEMSEIAIRSERFVLSKLLDNICFSAEVQAKAKGLEFSLLKDDTMHDYYIGDEKRIAQIITNLVSNAIKYTEKGSIILTVSYVNGSIMINCSDTGQGIAEDSLGSLFDPYVRFNEVKNANIQGTGLGLSVVKKIIEGMKGEISVESTLGVGSSFTVSIPAELADESAKEQELDYSGKELKLSTITALCVDDSMVNTQIIAGLLGKLGASADVAFSGASAVEMSSQRKYDIIFMDHMMPQMDGIEAFKNIRKNGMNLDTPVVILTGNADENHAEYYKEQGVDGYLIKPVLKDQLLEMMKRIFL